MAEFNFRYLCTPAKIYFAIAVIAAIFALLNGAGLMVIFMNLNDLWLQGER
jgi:stringent starvation protein B